MTIDSSDPGERLVIDLNGVDNLITGSMIRTALRGCRREMNQYGTTEYHDPDCGHGAPGWIA